MRTEKEGSTPIRCGGGKRVESLKGGGGIGGEGRNTGIIRTGLMDSTLRARRPLHSRLGAAMRSKGKEHSQGSRRGEAGAGTAPPPSDGRFLSSTTRTALKRGPSLPAWMQTGVCSRWEATLGRAPPWRGVRIGLGVIGPRHKTPSYVNRKVDLTQVVHV